jgi:hypothetical protein
MLLRRMSLFDGLKRLVSAHEPQYTEYTLHTETHTHIYINSFAGRLYYIPFLRKELKLYTFSFKKHNTLLLIYRRERKLIYFKKS